MDDLIYRQAVLEATSAKIKITGKENAETVYKYIKKLCDDIKALPSAQQWIPCSERLPEDGTIALVCGKKGGIRVARVFIPYATGNWYGDPNTNWWTIVGTGKPFYPVAWMPLPEPYKEIK